MLTPEELSAQSEAIANWTYPGATLYYKDCDLTPQVRDQFTENKILRNGYFLDVSSIGGGLACNTRFLIASSKAAKLYEVNPDNARFGHCCINCDSYFKILDVYQLNGKTQIFLLHIPATAIAYFMQVTTNIDKDFIARARNSFNERITQPPVPDLQDPTWVHRTNYPVGMDGYNRFYPLNATSPMEGQALSLFTGIRSMTGDTSNINVPQPFIAGSSHNEAPEDRPGFWKRLFGK